MSQTIDLTQMTPDAVRNNVLKTTLTGPMTVYPILIGFGVVAFWLIFDAGWLFATIGALAVTAGISLWALNYFGRYTTYQVAYFKKIREDNEQAARKKLRNIQQFLNDRNWDQAAAQISKLEAKKEAFEKVLARKFEEGEMAYARYHGVAEQVYLNALANLESLSTQLEAIDTIDPDYIKTRIEELYFIAEENGGSSDAQLAERETLEKRWNLRESTLESIDMIIAENEKAMTELDEIASKIAKSKTDGKDVEKILKESIEKLNELSDEAERNWG